MILIIVFKLYLFLYWTINLLRMSDQYTCHLRYLIIYHRVRKPTLYFILEVQNTFFIVFLESVNKIQSNVNNKFLF